MRNGVGVIFAGGRATRLDEISKGDIRIGDRTCFERVYTALASQFETIAVSLAKQNDLDLPTILDWPSVEADNGVVFSILAVVKWAADNGFDYAVTSPCDTPFLPSNFVVRLAEQHEGSQPVVCISGGRAQNLHALWPTACFEKLKHMILEEGERKAGLIHKRLASQPVVFDTNPIDLFLNINTPEDLTRAEMISEQLGL